MSWLIDGITRVDRTLPLMDKPAMCRLGTDAGNASLVPVVFRLR